MAERFTGFFAGRLPGGDRPPPDPRERELHEARMAAEREAAERRKAEEQASALMRELETTRYAASRPERPGQTFPGEFYTEFASVDDVRAEEQRLWKLATSLHGLDTRAEGWHQRALALTEFRVMVAANNGVVPPPPDAPPELGDSDDNDEGILIVG